jgi:hypothetical protein
MEEWRVFIRRFLERAYQEYFERSFDNTSAHDLIDDPQLRRLAVLTEREISSDSWEQAASAAKVGFTLSTWAVFSLPSNQSFRSSLIVQREITRGFGQSRSAEALDAIVGKILSRVEDVREYAAIIGSGVPLAAFERYQRIGIHVSLTVTGIDPMVAKPIAEEDARWLQRFTVETLLKWQSSGLAPRVPEHLKGTCESYLQKHEQPAVTPEPIPPTHDS